MSKIVPIILAVLAIIALCYLFMNSNDMSRISNVNAAHPMRSNPMNNAIENFGNRAGMQQSKRPSQRKARFEEVEEVEEVENFKGGRVSPPKRRSRFEEVGEMEEMEHFSPTQQAVSGSEEIEFIEQPQYIGQTDTGSQMNKLPSECYPKDVLSSVDLLPSDANSLWAQVNPSGQGSLADQNFLTSGFHIGINTVGQTLRNANRQLRSEPLNPQVKVSPWMQTTIDPDINRRPLEINSGDL